MTNHQNLVIIRAGPNSLHPHWVKGTVRSFDLLVLAYSESAPNVSGPSITNEFIPGSKLSGYLEAFQRFPHIFDQYATIALLDDDLDASSEQLDTCFEIGFRNGLQLWQPSLTHESFFTYAIFLKNPKYTLRFVNFIESQCPFFSQQAMRAAYRLFEYCASTGIDTAIDLLWTRLLDDPMYKYAVIDAVAIKHTRPVGTTRAQRGLVDAQTHERRILEVLSHFGVPWPSGVAYAGIRRDGRFVKGRRKLAMDILCVVDTVAKSPNSKRHTITAVLDHARHTLTRPLNMERISL